MDQEPLPPEVWGVDHFSTLLYAESRAVDNGGILNPEQMRTGGFRKIFFSGKEYPTLLRDGEKQYNHDDWSCLLDMQAAGLLSVDMQKNTVALTSIGWQVAGGESLWTGVKPEGEGWQDVESQPNNPLTHAEGCTNA